MRDSPEKMPEIPVAPESEASQPQPENTRPRAERWDELNIGAGDTVYDTKGNAGRIVGIQRDPKNPSKGMVIMDITTPDGQVIKSGPIPTDNVLRMQHIITRVERPDNSEGVDTTEIPAEEENAEPANLPKPKPRREVSPKKEKRTREQLTNTILENRREQRFLKAAQEEITSLRHKTRQMDEAAEAFGFAKTERTQKEHTHDGGLVLLNFQKKLTQVGSMPYVEEHFQASGLDGINNLSMRKNGKKLTFKEDPAKLRAMLHNFEGRLDEGLTRARQELKLLEREAELEE